MESQELSSIEIWFKSIGYSQTKRSLYGNLISVNEFQCVSLCWIMAIV